MRKLLHEFRDFIMTGNVIDLSVAVLLATAVGSVVSGFTEDVMMPIVGHFTGGMDFSNLKMILSEASIDADGNELKPENAILYGKWINAVINLIIVGFVLFMIVKGYGKVKDLRKKQEEEQAAQAPETPAAPTQEELLAEIRDELRKQNK